MLFAVNSTINSQDFKAGEVAPGTQDHLLIEPAVEERFRFKRLLSCLILEWLGRLPLQDCQTARGQAARLEPPFHH